MIRNVINLYVNLIATPNILSHSFTGVPVKFSFYDDESLYNTVDYLTKISGYSKENQYLTSKVFIITVDYWTKISGYHCILRYSFCVNISRLNLDRENS